MVGLRTDKFRPIGNPLLQAVSSLPLRSPRGTRRIGNGYGNGLPATALGELVGELGPELRLLRGESLDLLARETAQPAGRIAGWREEFLTAGREGLKSRPRPVEERELADAQRKVGQLQLEVDILRALLEKKGHPQSPRRSR